MMNCAKKEYMFVSQAYYPYEENLFWVTISIIIAIICIIQVDRGIILATPIFFITVVMLKRTLSMCHLIVINNNHYIEFISFRGVHKQVEISKITKIKRTGGGSSPFICVFYQNNNQKINKIKVSYNVYKLKELFYILLYLNPHIVVKGSFLKSFL
jgi:hypothetical protein